MSIHQAFLPASCYFCQMNMEALYKIYLRYPSVQTDSRKLKNGDLFFALKGPSFNGNVFSQKALEDGAAYAVIDDPAFALGEKTILVDDVLSTLQQLAKHHRSQFNIPFIGVTGSNGKTTTKELIHAVLSTTYRTYTTEGNLNNHIGVPLTILKIRPDAEMAVIEMGANHRGEIASYCTIAQPDFGLITNCGKAHLEGFGGEEGVRLGKGELFDYLRSHNGTAFVFNDYDYLRDMSRGIQTIIPYGTKEGFVAGETADAGQYLSVRGNRGFLGKINTHLVGDYNLPNVLAAITIGTYFKVTEERIKNAIEAYTPTNSRSQLLQKGSNKIILDAYNANPSSMKAAIRNFAKSEGRHKFLVLGAMAELGEESVGEHEDIIDEIENYHWDDVLLVGGDFLKIDGQFKKFANPEEAGAWLKDKKIRDAYLLIKGSRSIQMEKVLDYL
jgi:UDP-N-acetylmuramoyl-tripeptide--D-alanyl-D-alanine ligase